MRYITFLLLSLLPVSAQAAKPISWAGGIAASTMNDEDGSMNHLTYSFSGKTAVSARLDWFFQDDSVLTGVQGHRLLKRWNFEDGQANIYLTAGAGAAFQAKRSNAAVFGGVMTDYETRRFFVMYENDSVYAGDIMQYHWHSGRLGWAPYKVAYEKIQPWLMLKTDYRSDVPHKWQVTPMVRLFTPDWMFEAGINTRGKPMINLMLQW
jgi:hypothetical protein